jgi:dihydroorotate dehydrogenase
MNLYPYFRACAFLLEAEQAHNLAIASLQIAGPLLPNRNSEIDFNISAFGLHFKNPVGLAAGLDKNAQAIDFFTHIPFGFVEVGTVTPKAQAGNEGPRLFRYPDEESIRNRMGFNNSGSEVVLSNIKKSNRREKILGINLGKNKITPNEKSAADYALLYKTFAPVADYLVINVSSPNTPGLRDLLADQGLREIFEAVTSERKKIKRPLLVKISPDMSNEQMSSVVKLVKEYSLDGIVATNTTIIKERGEGGMSGKILSQKAKMAREYLLRELKETPEIELIGVGGFSTFSDLKEFWKAGGKLAQIYSALIFQGPRLIYDIERQLEKEFKEIGCKSFSEYLMALTKIKN